MARVSPEIALADSLGIKNYQDLQKALQEGRIDAAKATRLMQINKFKPIAAPTPGGAPAAKEEMANAGGITSQTGISTKPTPKLDTKEAIALALKNGEIDAAQATTALNALGGESTGEPKPGEKFTNMGGTYTYAGGGNWTNEKGQTKTTQQIGWKPNAPTKTDYQGQTITQTMADGTTNTLQGADPSTLKATDPAYLAEQAAATKTMYGQNDWIKGPDGLEYKPTLTPGVYASVQPQNGGTKFYNPSTGSNDAPSNTVAGMTKDAYADPQLQALTVAQIQTGQFDQNPKKNEGLADAAKDVSTAINPAGTTTQPATTTGTQNPLDTKINPPSGVNTTNANTGVVSETKTASNNQTTNTGTAVTGGTGVVDSTKTGSGTQIDTSKVELPFREEQRIATQRDDNPVSNALAIGRAVDAEFRPIMPTSADVRSQVAGYGMGDYLDTGKLSAAARDLFSQQAERDYTTATEALRNRYGGIGTSGLQQRREGELAQDYSLGKAKGIQDINQYWDTTGYNRNREMLGDAANLLGANAQRQEGRFSDILQSGLQQNALQVGATQQERDRAAREAELATRLRHESGMEEWRTNQQAKQGLQSQLLGLAMEQFFPKEDTAFDKYLQMQIAKESGMSPEELKAGPTAGQQLFGFLGNEVLPYFTQQMGINEGTLGELGLDSADEIGQLAYQLYQMGVL